MGITLDQEERSALVGTHGEAVLTTTRREGQPTPLPVWYVVIDGTPYVRTPRSAKRLQHIARDPRVAFLVHAGTAWTELRGVLINAHAEVVDDPDVVVAVERAHADRFAGLLPPPLPDRVARTYALPATLRITPTGEPVSWDNRKIRR